MPGSKPRVAVLVAVTVLSFGFSIRQERPNSLVLATAADSPTKPASVGKTLANKQARLLGACTSLYEGEEHT